MQCNELGDAGGEAIAQALSCNRSLKFLDLDANSLGDVAARAMARVLETNSTLQELDLACLNQSHFPILRKLPLLQLCYGR
jgi:Ran GTPase-activating protein (RanGAP) involved in mRNA processing and transport